MLFKKKRTDVAWRNSDGEITCAGHSCTKGCDRSCPVWLSICGMIRLNCYQCEDTIRDCKDALALAPDFFNAQVFLADAYAMSGQHKKARAAYQKALKMDPQSHCALNGLIVSEKKLGMFMKALRHCDLADRRGMNTDQLREGISNAMNGMESGKPLQYADVAATLLAMGRKAGFIQSEGFPFIPEIAAAADEVCAKLIFALKEYIVKHPGEVLNPSSAMLCWACFAGMGAVYHWHADWNALLKNGIYETLVMTRGLSEMDDYVVDLIGLTGEEQFALMKLTHDQVQFCCSVLLEGSPSTPSFTACIKAMYLFGMVFEMNRLEML